MSRQAQFIVIGVLVLMGSWLNWGAFTAKVHYEAFSMKFDDVRTFTLNGWSGSISNIPNWVCTLLATGAALVGVMRFDVRVGITLAILACLQLSGVGFVMLMSEKASIGPGGVVVFLTMAWAIALFLKRRVLINEDKAGVTALQNMN